MKKAGPGHCDSPTGKANPASKLQQILQRNSLFTRTVAQLQRTDLLQAAHFGQLEGRVGRVLAGDGAQTQAFRQACCDGDLLQIALQMKVHALLRQLQVDMALMAGLQMNAQLANL